MEQFEDNTHNGMVIKTEYDALVHKIDRLWTNAKSRAASAVDTQLLDANWETGKDIVEFEQQGNVRAEYGKKLIIQLSKHLTARRGRGFIRSNIIYMRKLYLCFP